MVEIEVPLNYKYDSTVYRIHLLFISLSNGNSATIDSKNEIVVIGPKRSFYTYITQYEFHFLYSQYQYPICDVHTSLFSIKANLTCEYLLITHSNKYRRQKFNIIKKKLQSNYYIGLQSTRSWLLSVKNRESLDLHYPSLQETISITETGILEFKLGWVATENGIFCKMYYKRYTNRLFKRDKIIGLHGYLWVMSSTMNFWKKPKPFSIRREKKIIFQWKERLWNK